MHIINIRRNKIIMNDAMAQCDPYISLYTLLYLQREKCANIINTSVTNKLTSSKTTFYTVRIFLLFVFFRFQKEKKKDVTKLIL